MGDPLVCYLASDNVVTSTNQYFPCGSSDISGASAQSCCNAEDYCMENNICHYTRGGVTNGTGYYMAGCTDPTWQDPSCPKQCTSEIRPDIIYDRSSSEWRCCDSTADSLNCQVPSDFVVEAPDPEELSTLLQLSTPAPSSTAATSITAITSIQSTAATTTAAPSKTVGKTIPAPSKSAGDTEEGLSSGAKAGVAIAIISICVLAIGAFLWWRIRTPKPKNETKKHKSEESRVILPDPYRPSGAFTALSSQPNSALPSPGLPPSVLQSPVLRSPGPRSPAPQFDSQRDSEFPISLHETAVLGNKARFSYEYDIGPYEMDSPVVHQRVPYERPLSAQELEGTTVQLQELDANPVQRGLGIQTPESETPPTDVKTPIPDKDK